uniref:Uncharacterized protein n=1 Tax=Anguilla anguilla TaxID=7936 RepID=A0A0E9QX52_ANGAN
MIIELHGQLLLKYWWHLADTLIQTKCYIFTYHSIHLCSRICTEAIQVGDSSSDLQPLGYSPVP